MLDNDDGRSKIGGLAERHSLLLQRINPLIESSSLTKYQIIRVGACKMASVNKAVLERGGFEKTKMLIKQVNILVNSMLSQSIK